jgi:hypothetical protein
MRFLSRRQFFWLTLTQAGIATTIGCGTVLHPERRGQPAGRIDWKIAALDGLGLLLFFVPGVIAFAVDFTTGAIYLPPDHYGLRSSNRRGEKLVTVKLRKEKMTLHKLERVISEQTKRDIQLTAGAYHTEELDNIDQFWTATDKLAAR